MQDQTPPLMHEGGEAGRENKRARIVRRPSDGRIDQNLPTVVNLQTHDAGNMQQKARSLGLPCGADDIGIGQSGGECGQANDDVRHLRRQPLLAPSQKRKTRYNRQTANQIETQERPLTEMVRPH